MTRPAVKRRSAAKRVPPGSAETRERLITAARGLFVERGFEHVSVRDICQAAKANVAAVNYHFGDKLGLYREVVQQAIVAVRDVTELSLGPMAGASAEDRLRHYIQTFLPRVAKPADDRQWIGKLLNHEMSAPTPMAPTIFAEAIMPRLLRLRDVIVEMLDCDPEDPRVAHCVTSVQALCLFYRPDPFRSAVVPGWAPVSAAAVAALADHIAHFSLAGIKALKKLGAPAGIARGAKRRATTRSRR